VVRQLMFMLETVITL